MKKILVVAAHPDDEVLGCGGTILKHIQAGDEVSCLILGNGVTARYENEADAAPEVEKRRQAMEKALGLLGIKQHWLENFPDNRFDSVPMLDVVKTIERVKTETSPDVIYTHFVGDLNVDHEVAFRAVLTACRPVAGNTVKEILCFEIPSSTEWNWPSDGPFQPNVFVDISKTLDQKLAAMSCYDTESPAFPHPRSSEGLDAIAKRWGTVAGIEAAEAFVKVREIR